MNSTFTSAQQALADGFQANLSVWGRLLRTDTNENVTAIVEDLVPIDDPEISAKQKNPVYVNVVAAIGSVNNPRDITKFFRDHINYYRVLKFQETEGDLITWRWTCEAQRKT